MILGLLGKKMGMTQVFLEDGRVEGVTAVLAGPCTVTQVKSRGHDGYEAVQLGFEETRRLSKALEGHLRRTGQFRYLREVPAQDLGVVQVGQRVDVSMFQPGMLVDVTGVSKGRGFAGVVKRHHFAGGPRTHGQSDRQRHPGAIGSGTRPGRVVKGLRMAGHMGNRRVTARNLEVVQVDPARNLVFLKGAVPGARNQLVMLRQAKAGLARMEQNAASSA
ncbi:MAG: 50S ribosomal protein L3 [Chloroflexi bacterium]|nr:50S ribosomal protein L3 [Chloroflexota bacterium]